jgi:DNA-3-methyladenine glycosylase I
MAAITTPNTASRRAAKVGCRFGPDDLERLLADPGIIRNRLKVGAAVENARRIRLLRTSHGPFSNWLEAHHPRSIEAWTPLFRRTFRFTGGQIVNEFLTSLGYLPGAHEPDCPVYARCSSSRLPGLGLRRPTAR